MKIEEKQNMFVEVQQELKQELDVDISIEEINNIFQSQFKIMAYGLIKGIATTIPFFGKFIPIERDFYSKKFIIPNRIEQAKLIEGGDVEGAVDSYINNVKAVKKHKRAMATQPLLSAEQVLAYNDNMDIPDDLDIFKNMK